LVAHLASALPHFHRPEDIRYKSMLLKPLSVRVHPSAHDHEAPVWYYRDVLALVARSRIGSEGYARHLIE
jgi:hypothetical protein